MYALDDARTPARLGVIGVVLSAVQSAWCSCSRSTCGGGRQIEGWGDIMTFGPLPAAARENALGSPPRHRGPGHRRAAISDWIEYRLLARALAWRVGRTHLAGRWLGQIAVGCGGRGGGVAGGAGARRAALAPGAALVVGPAALAYVAITWDVRRPGQPASRAWRPAVPTRSAAVRSAAVVSPSRWE